MKIYIHTNNKQLIGAKLSQYSIQRFHPDVSVELINVDEIEAFQDFVGKKYLRKGVEITYTKDDLQSFTLSRFMPPQHSGYTGKAMVIDPDIFAVRPIDELLNLDLQDKAIACCTKNEAYDTSMMVMQCDKLQHWSIEDILSKLADKQLDYKDIMTLQTEDPKTILEVPRKYNSLDKLENDTKLLHTTNRLTQPWKTGLKIDFSYEKMKPYFGLIPREPVLKLLGRIETHYQPHPDKNIEDAFFKLAKEALDAGAITTQDIEYEIAEKHVRADFFEKLAQI